MKMNTTRITPRQRIPLGSASRQRASPGSIVRQRNSPGSAPRSAKSTSRLNTTFMNGRSTVSSFNLAGDTVDYDLELKFSHNDYLQAVFKQNITKTTITQHKQDMSDQLSIYAEKMYRTEENLAKLQEEFDSMEVLRNTEDTISHLQNALEIFNKSIEEYNLEDTLSTLRFTLEAKCMELSLINVNPLESQEKCNELYEIIKRIIIGCKQFEKSRDFDEINRVVTEIKRWKVEMSSAFKNYESLLLMENGITRDFLKASCSKFMALNEMRPASTE